MERKQQAIENRIPNQSGSNITMEKETKETQKTVRVDLSLFMEEYKPGHGSNFNCVKSTEDICQILMNQGQDMHSQSELSKELAAQGYNFLTAEGTVMWKLVEKD
jgi:hypothetical protein